MGVMSKRSDGKLKVGGFSFISVHIYVLKLRVPNGKLLGGLKCRTLAVWYLSGPANHGCGRN